MIFVVVDVFGNSCRFGQLSLTESSFPLCLVVNQPPNKAALVSALFKASLLAV